MFDINETVNQVKMRGANWIVLNEEQFQEFLQQLPHPDVGGSHTAIAGAKIINANEFPIYLNI